MATNPKKSHKREHIKQQSEKSFLNLGILTDCLSDIFDKYSILSYKNADANTDIYWTYQRVKEYQPARYNGSITYRPLSGISIKNLSRSFSFDDDFQLYSINHNRYKGGYIQKDIGSIKSLIKEMTGCDIEVRYDYNELLILLR
jgi:hypothetical protein